MTAIEFLDKHFNALSVGSMIVLCMAFFILLVRASR